MAVDLPLVVTGSRRDAVGDRDRYRLPSVALPLESSPCDRARHLGDGGAVLPSPSWQVPVRAGIVAERWMSASRSPDCRRSTVRRRAHSNVSICQAAGVADIARSSVLSSRRQRAGECLRVIDLEGAVDSSAKVMTRRHRRSNCWRRVRGRSATIMRCPTATRRRSGCRVDLECPGVGDAAGGVDGHRAAGHFNVPVLSMRAVERAVPVEFSVR